MSAAPATTEADEAALPFSELAPLAPSLGRREAPLSLGARLWGWAASAIPIGILAVLAGTSWWLVQNAPQATGPVVNKPPTHDPDLELRQFSMRDFNDQGVQQALIEGATLRHFPDTRQVLIDQARMLWEDAQGIPHQAMSEQALGDDRTRDVQLMGDATVVRQASDGATVFHSERIWVSPTQEEVLSTVPVRLEQSDGAELRADSFRYSERTGQVTLDGQVRGRLPMQAHRALP